MTTIHRTFMNERGNAITVSVGDDMPDSDAVCRTCRWRGGHDPKCARASDPWPTFKVKDDEVFISIVGPRTVSTNLVTRFEANELLVCLAEFLHPAAKTDHRARRSITVPRVPRMSLEERVAEGQAQRNLAWGQGRSDYVNAKDVNRYKEGQEGYAEWQAGWSLMKAVADQFPKGERCHGQRDGECSWHLCPQLRDGESAKTGRHCPLDRQDEEEF